MKKIFYLVSFCLFLLMYQFSSAQNPVGIFDGQSDIGKVLHPGSAVYNSPEQDYTVHGSGTNMWFTHDQFHFVWKKLKGDFILRANVAFIGKGVEPHRKMGWMVRSSLDSASAHVNAVVHGSGLTSLQFRRTTGDSTAEIKTDMNGANVIQLERRGNRYIMSVAHTGEKFTDSAELTDINLGDEVYVGIFVCSHNPDVTEAAVFRNVRIVVPASPDFTPYRTYIGSDIQLLNVFTGNSRIIYQSPRSLQAPNWTKNGKSLIYNSEGLLYRFDLATGKPALLNTGSVKNNNNDHVISFDGKMLAISSGTEVAGKNVSISYTVPITGGEPRRITATGPSYSHGWSPDGKFVVFTGQRDNEFDIYRIAASGGKETRLTTTPGLDDGPEYSPDGKYIYFNSVRSGMMQIWRMNPDGSNPQQLTHDDRNNWFPHISPDGKWLVYISFGKEIKPDDHPFYKQVYLCLMPAAGGTPKVIAYLYGGQGTINTPSWSPDNTHIAFVSNNQLLFPVFPIGK